MAPDLLITLLAALISSLLGASRILVQEESIQRFFRRLFRLPPPVKSYSEQIAELTKSLESASSRVDEILREMSEVVRGRQSSVEALEGQLATLSQKEAELKSRIESLSRIPIPAAEHFAALVSKGERRAALRDYALFGAGVLVSTAISIALRIAGI
jgi:chromosome segregation ATPase